MEEQETTYEVTLPLPKTKQKRNKKTETESGQVSRFNEQFTSNSEKPIYYMTYGVTEQNSDYGALFWMNKERWL